MSRTGKSIGTESRFVVTTGWWADRIGRHGVSFGVTQMFWNWIGVMVVLTSTL